MKKRIDILLVEQGYFDSRERAKKALDNNLPLFVSEWGTSKADGSNGKIHEEYPCIP